LIHVLELVTGDIRWSPRGEREESWRSKRVCWGAWEWAEAIKKRIAQGNRSIWAM